MKTITMAVISTSHISKQTDGLFQSLADRNPWTIAAPYDEGVFIYIQSEDVEGQPTELGDIFAWARKHSYEWVCIDTAGDIVDELPSYDWN